MADDEDVVTLDNLSTGFEAAVTAGELVVGDTGDAALHFVENFGFFAHLDSPRFPNMAAAQAAIRNRVICNICKTICFARLLSVIYCVGLNGVIQRN